MLGSPQHEKLYYREPLIYKVILLPAIWGKNDAPNSFLSLDRTKENVLTKTLENPKALRWGSVLKILTSDMTQAAQITYP